jgi:hypothetical protein
MTDHHHQDHHEEFGEEYDDVFDEGEPLEEDLAFEA